MTKPPAIYYSVLHFEPENLALLRRHFDVAVLADPKDDTADALATVELLFAPLGFIVDSGRIGRCPRLKVIASNTTGVPHIDMTAARNRGIVVCALHDEQVFLDTITSTAEHTFGLILAAHRRIPAAHLAASKGAWSRWSWGAPRMLSRMRLGIVGYGRLGSKVAKIGRAVGMNVDYYDPYVPGGAATLIELAKHSDVFTLHAPANPETHGLISRQVIRALPRGAIFVNTARGELVDTDQLLAALADGHLYAAALDTIDGEYDPAFVDGFGDTPLARYARSHDNLILTPHIGGSTRDAWRETQERVIRKAMAVFDICADE